MTKIALSLLALVALSTASFAENNREDFGTNGSYSGGVVIETAPLAVYGGSNGFAGSDIDNHQGR